MLTWPLPWRSHCMLFLPSLRSSPLRHRRSHQLADPLNEGLISEDCALAYTDLLDDVGSGRLTPEEAQTISAIVGKRAELFASVELAAEIDALKAQLAAIVGAQRPTPIRRPFAIT